MDKEIKIKEWTYENKPMGELLGYPDCCINEFCITPPDLIKNIPKLDLKKRVLAGHVNNVFTGFIPCLNHANQILSGKITLESLIDYGKRDLFLPKFPNAYK